MATIEPRGSHPVAGVPVYFKVWDVDDPFDRIMLGMPNVELIDNDTVGPDNRPSGESPETFSADTDAYGRAEWTIEVSMQPGNNFRAAATCVDDVFGGSDPQVDQSDADAKYYYHSSTWSGYEVPAVWSRMLTVWRKLHVEVDSMGAPNWTNTQSGNIPAGPTFDPGNNHAFVALEGLHAEFEKPDQHKVGRIDILTFGSFTTVGTDISDSPYKVEIVNAPANIVTAAGIWYTLWDDDVGSADGFTMVGFDAPPVTLPKVPNTSLMAQVFQNAYVEVASPDMQYYDPDTFFDRNVADNEAANKAIENRDLTSAADFWAVHITSAFQGYVDKDNDPDTEQAAPQGLQYGVTKPTGFLWGRRAGSLVYLETIRDDKRGNAPSMTAMERYTVTHETGHQFLLEHEDGQWPLGDEQDPTGDYIMTNVTDQTGMAPNVAFSAVSLKKTREIEYPPQP